jgi:hypothetical protein
VMICGKYAMNIKGAERTYSSSMVLLRNAMGS